ncbi:Hypothetical protein NTJ_05062 [Nesidiocoris tenuis]|uniref:Uncharacterized protein n=1 Tax=Nesidiocoris tenuis TaxID=355587 RepID=A0ABN7AJL0_9HEMI|nr:Hypothetical protein NTJ_05062 [Nesidiocoris tenuis]
MSRWSTTHSIAPSLGRFLPPLALSIWHSLIMGSPLSSPVPRHRQSRERDTRRDRAELRASRTKRGRGSSGPTAALPPPSSCSCRPRNAVTR